MVQGQKQPSAVGTGNVGWGVKEMERQSLGRSLEFLNFSGNTLEIYHLVYSYESPFSKTYTLKFSCN